jgi:hypothetical protein
MTGEAIKPCPFCGGEAKSRPTFFDLQPQIACACGAKIWAHTEAEATAAWNTRPDPDLARRAASVDMLIVALGVARSFVNVWHLGMPISEQKRVLATIDHALTEYRRMK